VLSGWLDQNTHRTLRTR